jgi:hypothetical protein
MLAGEPAGGAEWYASAVTACLAIEPRSPPPPLASAALGPDAMLRFEFTNQEYLYRSRRASLSRADN